MEFLSGVVHFSLRNRAVILVATALLLVLGVRAALRLPLDAVPDVTNVQVQVITAAPALSPTEIEQYVTIPVERSLSGVPGVTEVRSLSKYGVSVVTVVFREDMQLYFARQLVSERMREAEDAVPKEYGKPELGPISSGLGEIFQFVVRGEQRTLMELEETLDWYIGPQLRSVPGIVEVNSFGGENREYQVVLDAGRLQASGLSVREVVDALSRSNRNAGGGYIEHAREQIVIGTTGLIHSLEDLRTVVVGATPQGVPITIAHIGEARFGPKLRRGAATMDGQGEVAIGVAMMLIGENSRTVTEAVKAKLDALRPSLPPGIRIEPFYDRSALVDRTIATVLRNLTEGAALVILVLFLLLGNLRAGLIVACTIPLAMLGAVLVMDARGASGNLMSLGAIDFGLIVDGAVIIVENAVRRLSEARSASGTELSAEQRCQIVSDATMEVRGATVFGEAIIAIVYIPILALQGMEGKLFTPMALTVLYALGTAFVLSLTLIPVLCSLLLRPAATSHEGGRFGIVQGWYARLLSHSERSVRRRVFTLSLGVLLLAMGIGIGSRLGAEFVPQLDEGDLLLEVRRLPGIALSESVAVDLRMQQALAQIPEVAHAVARAGSPELATDPMGIEQSDVYLMLTPRAQWRKGLTKAALGTEITELLEREVPEAAISLSQPIQMRTNELIAGIRSDVAAMVYGPDLEQLKELGERMAAVLRTVKGAVDVRVEQIAGLRYLRVHPDRARLARYGLTVEDLNQLTQMLAVGCPAGTVLEAERRFDLMVRLDVQYDGTLDALRALPLKATTGQVVPLGDVADLAIEEGPVAVNRDQQSRRLIVEFNVQGQDLVSAVSAAQGALARQVPLSPGYRIEWGGQFRHYLEARNRLALVVPLSLALIFFLLWLAFSAVRPALLVFFNIPFAAVGGVVALWLRQIPFSISAGVGFIALFGVAVLNGLVLVAFSRRLEAGGMAPAEAIVQAARLRLRPVLTTALVASLGFLPMALSQAPGSEVQRPLATVVVGGLITATLLTLLLFPAAYALVAGSPVTVRTRV
ncbi:MAG: efflux RND transporter permease subunit [Myxococcales bacterium]|jgi:cobalt-zinc-cadmium resistance protein CzcA|nr:efflux RND transporter permease subunit [Myxococcales bacterium]